MNLLPFTNQQISARFLAGITVVSLLLSAFPASFFGFNFAEAAPANVEALVINEIHVDGTSEWVEIYNPGSSAVGNGEAQRLSIHDSTGHVIDLPNSNIPSDSYVVLEVTNRFNDGGDTIELIYDNPGNGGEEVVDSLAYGSEGSVSLPNSGETISRIPNGTGNFTSAIPTEGENNEPAAQTADYCDPTQKPGGVSIAQWHDNNNFDGSDCFEYEVVQECGSLDIQFTSNDTPYSYVFSYVIGDTVPVDYEDGLPMPATFTEDEYGGTVDVTYYVVGSEKDYFVGSDVPNFWDKNGTTVAVDTDCEAPVEKDEVEIDIYGDTSAGENLPGWLFNRDGSTATEFEFNDDEATTGVGSAYVFPIDGSLNGNADKFIAEYFYLDTMDTLTSLSYDFLIGSGGSASDANEFYLNVYANFGVSSPTKFYDCRYNVVPATGSTGSFTTFTFDPDNNYPVATSGSSPETCPAAPADMGDDAVIRVFAINLGDTSANDAGVDGYFDTVVLETDTEITTFDFEPTPETTKPTITVKDDAITCEDGYHKVSFKLFDVGKIDKLILNGVEKDLTDNKYSDFNNVEPGKFGAVEGVNVLQVFDVAGNMTELTFVLCDDPSSAPTATVKEGEEFTMTCDEGYEMVSFKLFDEDNIDRVVINGVEKDLTDNKWSDVNFLKPGMFGAVAGENTMVVYDVDGNNSTYTFFLCAEADTAEVTMCKYDGLGNPLSGWTLMLQGEEVAQYEVPANSPAGVDTAPLQAGVSHIVIAEGTWDNNRGPLNIVDAEYSTEDNWVASIMDGFTGFGQDILELFVGGTNGDWGPYNSLHHYAQAYVPTATGPVNLAINDTNYSDNTGSLDVTVGIGYVGVTETNGCVTFSDVPFGEYQVEELAQEGWVNLSGLGLVTVDEESETFEVVNRDPNEPAAEISVSKIVCNYEEELPNWGKNNDAPNITASTAADWLAANEDSSCALVTDWEFEWGLQSATNPGNTLVGPGGADWTTFTGTTSVPVSIFAGDNHLWVREVLQEGYIPFGENAKYGTPKNISAELYCHRDGLNYDNFDRIDKPKADSTYHCVAWNAPIEPVVTTCELPIYSDTGTLVQDTNQYAVATYDHSTWTNDIDGATWVWATEYVENPTQEETYTFVETFTVDNPTSAMLEVAADNLLLVKVNDEVVLDQTDQNNYIAPQTVNILSDLNITGENTVEFVVTNEAGVNSSLRNPAGVLYRIDVTGDAESCAITTAPGIVDETPEYYILDGYKNEVAGESSVRADGWTIFADNGIDTPLSTTTDENGYFYFEVPEGEWEVYEEDRTDWELVDIDQLGMPYIISILSEELEVSMPKSCTFQVGQPLEYDQLASSALVLDDVPNDEWEPISLYRCDFYNEFVGETDTTDPVDGGESGSNGSGDNDDSGSTSGSSATAQRFSSFSTVAPTPLVLGATTDAPQFCPFLTEYMQIGDNNDTLEVTKLQIFLNIFKDMFGGSENPVTGTFGSTTDANVKAFQQHFQAEILDPWFEQGIVPHNRPTGFVYKTTLWKINSIVCPDTAVKPDLSGEDLTTNVNNDID